jgi:hypothetical protein
MIKGEIPKVLRKTVEERDSDSELARIKQAISDHDQAHRYNGGLVAELLVHLGLIHSTPESRRRWSQSRGY